MSIKQAADSREALLKLAQQRTDLIFMDIELPGKNGLILTKKIREIYPHVVIVILTHHDFHRLPLPDRMLPVREYRLVQILIHQNVPMF